MSETSSTIHSLTLRLLPQNDAYSIIKQYVGQAVPRAVFCRRLAWYVYPQISYKEFIVFEHSSEDFEGSDEYTYICDPESPDLLLQIRGKGVDIHAQLERILREHYPMYTVFYARLREATESEIKQYLSETSNNI